MLPGLRRQAIAEAVHSAVAGKQQVVEPDHLAKALLEQPNGLARRIIVKARPEACINFLLPGPATSQLTCACCCLEFRSPAPMDPYALSSVPVCKSMRRLSMASDYPAEW